MVENPRTFFYKPETPPEMEPVTIVKITTFLRWYPFTVCKIEVCVEPGVHGSCPQYSGSDKWSACVLWVGFINENEANMNHA